MPNHMWMHSCIDEWNSHSLLYIYQIVWYTMHGLLYYTILIVHVRIVPYINCLDTGIVLTPEAFIK